VQSSMGNNLFRFDHQQFFPGQLDDVALVQLPPPSGLHLAVDQGFSALDPDFRFETVLDLVGQFQKLAEPDGEFFDSDVVFWAWHLNHATISSKLFE
jgi:hypothetical protein